MAGFDICQRQTMTVNHGLYYVDLTASLSDAKWLARRNRANPSPANKKNIFVAGQSYNFFLVHAKKDTEQTYQMYVGQGLIRPQT